MPADGFAPIVDAVGRCTAAHDLTLLLGGNNAVTRPAAHALGLPLDSVGLITLDAHFDLRETDQGLLNGNPVRGLARGRAARRQYLPDRARPLCQYRQDARRRAGGGDRRCGRSPSCRKRGIVAVIEEALDRLGHVERLMVDFDIDVIDRSQCPGAPGARPGGMPVEISSRPPAFSPPSRR